MPLLKTKDLRRKSDRLLEIKVDQLKEEVDKLREELGLLKEGESTKTATSIPTSTSTPVPTPSPQVLIKKVYVTVTPKPTPAPTPKPSPTPSPTPYEWWNDPIEVQRRWDAQVAENLKKLEEQSPPTPSPTPTPFTPLTNTILCNGTYWTPCPAGQSFNCPSSGSATCIIDISPEQAAKDAQTEILLAEYQQKVNDIDAQILKIQQDYYAQVEIEESRTVSMIFIERAIARLTDEANREIQLLELQKESLRLEYLQKINDL